MSHYINQAAGTSYQTKTLKPPVNYFFSKIAWFQRQIWCKIGNSDIFHSLIHEQISTDLNKTVSLKEKETQHSFAGLSNIYISGMWLWYMQALFINRVKQNRCLKSENPQPMVVTILPPCSGKQMWMWCSVVSSPAWWLITLSPIPEAARCQLLLRAG